MSTRSSQRLYCLRHFHAARPLPGQRDFERPLDERGLQQAGVIASEIISDGIAFSTVFLSPSLRTRQSAVEIGIADDDTRIRFEGLLYDAEPDAYFALIAADIPDNALIIGHNPGMEEFLGHLCGQGGEVPPALAAGLGTGCLAVVRMPAGVTPGPGSGILECVIDPEHL